MPRCGATVCATRKKAPTIFGAAQMDGL